MNSSAETGWIVDASVALKWFLPANLETDADIAREMIGRVGLRTTSLAFYEVGNRLARAAGLEPEDVAASLSFMDEICGPPVELIATDFAASASLANQHGITFYDASYVAIARRLNRVVPSADSHLLRPGLAQSLAAVRD